MIDWDTIRRRANMALAIHVQAMLHHLHTTRDAAGLGIRAGALQSQHMPWHGALSCSYGAEDAPPCVCRRCSLVKRGNAGFPHIGHTVNWRSLSRYLSTTRTKAAWLHVKGHTESGAPV